MTTTSGYGSWNTVVPREGMTLEACVDEALGEYAGDYDTEALIDAYRAAINEALPDGVVLAGNEFYGPAYPQDQKWDGQLDIAALVDGIDFWLLAAQHEITRSDEDPPADEDEAGDPYWPEG